LHISLILDAFLDIFVKPYFKYGTREGNFGHIPWNFRYNIDSSQEPKDTTQQFSYAQNSVTFVILTAKFWIPVTTEYLCQQCELRSKRLIVELPFTINAMRFLILLEMTVVAMVEVFKECKAFIV
jgi:hypothetical protein